MNSLCLIKWNIEVLFKVVFKGFLGKGQSLDFQGLGIFSEDKPCSCFKGSFRFLFLSKLLHSLDLSRLFSTIFDPFYYY